MIPFFQDPGNWEKARAVIDSWMGTPYRHLWMIKGRGADCSLFIGAVLVELGVVEKVEHAHYPPDWFVHAKIEVVKTEFANNIFKNMAPGFSLKEFEGLPPDLMRGDIPGFSMVKATGVTNHAGMLLDPPTDFIHSVRRRGVSLMHWGGYWIERTTSTYRVMVK